MSQARHADLTFCMDPPLPSSHHDTVDGLYPVLTLYLLEMPSTFLSLLFDEPIFRENLVNPIEEVNLLSTQKTLSRNDSMVKEVSKALGTVEMMPHWWLPNTHG